MPALCKNSKAEQGQCFNENIYMIISFIHQEDVLAQS